MPRGNNIHRNIRIKQMDYSYSSREDNWILLNIVLVGH